ncbi:MAG: hypothetical protein JXQ87_06150 [Bacteroidia bacterium]
MSQEQANTFWEWFENNQSKFLFLNQVDIDERNRLLNLLMDKLREYDENLSFEIGGHPESEKVDFIISADGIVDYFDSVESLVAKAPTLNNWNIVAFKPPMPEDHTIEINEQKFDAKKIIFIPLTNPDEPSAVAIRVCFADLDEENKNLYINASFLLLDALIGEKATALDIDYIEIEKTPADIAEYPFLHLTDIADYIKEVKGAVNN